MAKRKTSAAEFEARVTKVFNLLAIGVDRAGILQYGKEQNWQVGDRQIDRYMKAATEALQKLAKFDRDYELGLASKRLNELYQSLLKIQDYKGALNVQRERNKLFGLYAPTTQNINVSWRTEIIALLQQGTLTLEQVQRELGESLAQELFESIGLRVTTE